MKTTIELPDALFHRAKVLAAQRKTTLKQLMVEGLEHVTAATAIRQPAELTEDEKQFLEIDAYGIPVMKKRDVVVTNEMVNQMREELGI
jgi:predicted transcriptional regulator